MGLCKIFTLREKKGLTAYLRHVLSGEQTPGKWGSLFPNELLGVESSFPKTSSDQKFKKRLHLNVVLNRCRHGDPEKLHLV